MAPTAAMILMDARINSFAAITKPKSKAKPAFPLSPSAYPHLTPINLANAGFFHDPSDQSPDSDEEVDDTCKCFLCGLKLGGWDEDDDPHVEHVKRGQCAWAEFVCQPRVNRENGTSPTYTAESLPQSAANATWRESTYQKAWPHKQKSGWYPTVKRLAQAGFVYNASSDSKDAVLCPLCDYSVEGWEATDDPWKIHQDKAPDCEFFTAKVEGAEEKAPAKTRKARTAKSKRVTEAVEPQASEVDATDDEPEASSSKPPPRARRQRSRKKVADDTEEESADAASFVESAEEEYQPTTVAPKKTRGQPTKAKVTDEEDSVAEVDAAPKKSKRVTRKKTKASEPEEPSTSEAEVPSEADPAEEEPTPRPASKKSSRPRKTKSAKANRSEPEDAKASEMVPSEVEKESTSSRSKSSKAKTSSKRSQKSAPSSSSNSAPKPLSSQLDRFVNIPPSSPLPSSPAIKVAAPPSRIDEEDTPRASRPIYATSKPARPSPHSALTRDALDKSLTQGAMEARRVMEDLTLNAASVDDNPEKDRIPLTDEQKKMTLEQLVRSEMAKRQEIMRIQGEDMIRQWEEKTAQARRRIESL